MGLLVGTKDTVMLYVGLSAHVSMFVKQENI